MKSTLLIDSTRGLASDMLVASLIDCFGNKADILHELQLKIRNNMVLNIDCANSYERQGIAFKAVGADFKLGEHIHFAHHHSSLDDVYEFIDFTGFSQSVKDNAKSIYGIIAEAEAKVHGATPQTVHFHEVGQKRAIACIVCACALFEKLGVNEILFSHINTGYGTVSCAHGEVGVPAPATKVILENIPNFYCPQMVAGELCTPTGIALAKHFATAFISVEEMKERLSCATAIHGGVGIGQRDIGVANGVLTYII